MLDGIDVNNQTDNRRVASQLLVQEAQVLGKIIMQMNHADTE